MGYQGSREKEIIVGIRESWKEKAEIKRKKSWWKNYRRLKQIAWARRKGWENWKKETEQKSKRDWYVCFPCWLLQKALSYNWRKAKKRGEERCQHQGWAEERPMG